MKSLIRQIKKSEFYISCSRKLDGQEIWKVILLTNKRNLSSVNWRLLSQDRYDCAILESLWCNTIHDIYSSAISLIGSTEDFCAQYFYWTRLSLKRKCPSSGCSLIMMTERQQCEYGVSFLQTSFRADWSYLSLFAKACHNIHLIFKDD